MSKPAKRYIGDGAYVEFDGFSLVLTAEDGIYITDRIVLEPEVFQSLLDFVEEIKRARNTDFPTQPNEN
jgi:hypothetical protein